MSKEQFENFTKQLGLRKEVAAKLWEAEVTSPQQLGSLERVKLEKITSDPLLLNHFHPILRDNVIDIATAEDKYKKAVEVIKSHAKSKGDGNSSVASDSVPRNDTPCQGETQTPENQQQRNKSPAPPSANPVYIGGSNVLNFTGNFVQTSILSANTVFNNKDTSVGAYSVERKLEPDPATLSRDNLRWIDGHDFSTEGLRIPTSDPNFCARRRQDAEVYETVGARRALIINVTNFSDERTQPRLGADNDSRNVRNLLEGLGFTVESRFNKRAAEIKTIVKDFATNAENMNVDMVALYIGSHGERDERGSDVFLGADCGRVSFDDIKDMFSPINSPHLRDKPKIFFAQFCRQNATPDVTSDAIPTEVDIRLMDMVCAFATPPGNKAYRREAEGSWFVTALFRVLSQHAHNDDLLSMLTKVNNCVSAMEGVETCGYGSQGNAIQISEVVHSLRKKIFFFPGV